MRELSNAVRKALLLAQGGRIELATIRKALDGPGGVVRPTQGEGATHAVPSRHPLTAFISRQLEELVERELTARPSSAPEATKPRPPSGSGFPGRPSVKS